MKTLVHVVGTGSPMSPHAPHIRSCRRTFPMSTLRCPFIHVSAPFSPPLSLLPYSAPLLGLLCHHKQLDNNYYGAISKGSVKLEMDVVICLPSPEFSCPANPPAVAGRIAIPSWLPRLSISDLLCENSAEWGGPALTTRLPGGNQRMRIRSWIPPCSSCDLSTQEAPTQGRTAQS